MAIPKPPFYVSFAPDRLPRADAIDHSQSYPGPPGGSANRAGFTRVVSRARMTTFKETTPPDATGQVGLYWRSINVMFTLTDFMVAISSDYRVRSCAYRVTYAHEINEHVRDPIAIFYSWRDVVIRRLNAVDVPTIGGPQRMAEAAVPAAIEALETRLVGIVGTAKRQLGAALRAARDAHDSPASYRLVHSQCTDAEWASGR